MGSDEQIFEGNTIEVGYIITFEDARQDRFGQFPIFDQEPKQLDILRKMVEVEPTTPKAGYIFVNLRLQERREIDLGSIEYKRADIEVLLPRLARPGIIKHL
jgi:hypothetical protein